MSSRTAQASRAIAKAWENERELVSVGKGTRDWTPEQQKDILNTGKAHDADGKAFEGHHMQSVSNKPEYQGEPGNIQFLSRDEHLAAHSGSYQNPTNGFYDPLTGETTDFGNERFRACPIINLTDPINRPVVVDTITPENNVEDTRNKAKNEATASKVDRSIPANPVLRKPQTNIHPESTTKKKRHSVFGFLREKIGDGIDAVRDWWDDNGDIVKGVAKDLAPDALALLGGIAQSRLESKLESMERDRDISISRGGSQEDESSLSSLDDLIENPSEPLSDDSNIESAGIGTSKSPHLRRGHMSHFWTGPKDGDRVRIEKWIDDIHVNGSQESDESNDES